LTFSWSRKKNAAPKARKSLGILTSTNYRADVDGLRAVAVLPVILFHAGLSAVSSGFVVVNVFFVISGFVIALTLKKDLAADDSQSRHSVSGARVVSFRR
jgi:peptidoglycan/LPS O-acetylase OafA/YrhL